MGLDSDVDMGLSSDVNKVETAVPPRQKMFHLADFLSLSTGLSFVREGKAAIYRLVGYVMEDDACERVASEHIEKVKNCIEEQLPFLRDICTSSVQPIYDADSSPTNPYLSVWLDMQALRYGDEHAIMPLTQWQRIKTAV